jgi:hypothetical protein
VLRKTLATAGSRPSVEIPALVVAELYLSGFVFINGILINYVNDVVIITHSRQFAISI